MLKIKSTMKNKDSPLKTWEGLCKALKNADEEYCMQIFKEEEDGRRRPSFLRRIYGRLIKLQSQRKREELEEKL